FDMTWFSMANMVSAGGRGRQRRANSRQDYTPLRFVIKCFEANYPESLGEVLVYKAPWVFQGWSQRAPASLQRKSDEEAGIWKIIRGWLDPVVASKVHFANNMKEMEEFVSPDHIPEEMDGEEKWEYKYVE